MAEITNGKGTKPSHCLISLQLSFSAEKKSKTFGILSLSTDTVNVEEISLSLWFVRCHTVWKAAAIFLEHFGMARFLLAAVADQKYQKYLFGLFLIVLLHPYRFAELQSSLDAVESEEIKKHLVSNALSPNQQMATCRIDMNQRENLSFEKSHTFFAPILGGEWRPPECAAEFDSRPVKVQMLINQSTTIIIFFRHNHNTIS